MTIQTGAGHSGIGQRLSGWIRRHVLRRSPSPAAPSAPSELSVLADHLAKARGPLVSFAETPGSMPAPRDPMSDLVESARDVHIVNYGGEGRVLEGGKSYRRSR